MGLKVRRVDHQRAGLAALTGQFQQHPGEHTLVAPPLPTVVERLRRTVFRGRVPPSQPITINEDNPAQHAPVIDTWFAVGFREEGFEALHLHLRQPEKIAHVTARFSGSESADQNKINGS